MADAAEYAVRQVGRNVGPGIQQPSDVIEGASGIRALQERRLLVAVPVLKKVAGVAGCVKESAPPTGPFLFSAVLNPPSPLNEAPSPHLQPMPKY